MAIDAMCGKTANVWTAILTGFLACCSSPAFGNDLPVVNLGLTSYLDGVLPSGTGFYYQNYVEFYASNRINDANGARVPLPRQDVELWADINQFTYYFDKIIGPGRLALDLVIPVVASAHTDDGLGNAVLGAQAGLGDILFGPIFQFNPVSLGGGRSLHQSVEFDVLTPTGNYDRNLVVNPGNHAWALNPFYSATVFASDRLSLSGRFHYLYNFTNRAPLRALGPAVQKVQAGQAFHLNLDVAYALTKRLGIGINSYYLSQFTDTRINGSSTPGRRERVLGVGPGAFYQLSPGTFLFFNAYFETLAKNRTEGSRVVLRIVQHF